jgi:hypothetical protein
MQMITQTQPPTNGFVCVCERGSAFTERTASEELKQFPLQQTFLTIYLF